MFFPNFLTFTLETPILFQHRRTEDTKEKEDLHLHFLINYVQEEKRIFLHIKRGSKDLCYSSEPVYSPQDEPQQKKRNTISANRYTDNGNASVASPSNKSFRTNTFVRRQQTTIIFLKLFCLIGKHNWSESIFFSKPYSVNTERCFRNHRPKNIRILLTFKRPANL